jgi:flagellar assembly protein FliH
MSTDTVRPAVAAVLAHFPWQRAAPAPGQAPVVRPLITGDPDASVHHQGARDLVLPSVLAERTGVAQREGYDRGFAEGEQAGREAARLRTDAHFTRLTATIDELASLRSAMLRTAEQDIVRLAIAISERIVRREIRVNRQALSAMARAAAQKLGDNCLVTIHMNPDDLLAATEGRDTTLDAGPVRLTADVTIPPGGCLVQSAFGTIDLSVNAQIGEIERELLGDAESNLG